MEYELSPSCLPTYYRAAPISSPSDKPLPIYRSDRGETITALHHHSYLEIGICLSGSGINHVGNRIYRYREGDLQWVKPYEPHLSSTDFGTVSTWYWLYLDPFLLLKSVGIEDLSFYRALLEGGFSGMFHPTEHPDFAASIHKLRELLLRNGDVYKDREIGFLMGELLLHAGRLSDPEKMKEPPFGRILPCVTYISHRYAEKEAMREENLANVMGISASHLRLLFRKEAGVPPKTFVLRTQLAAAANRLCRTEDTVLTVALSSGFEQASSFNRAFRKVYKMSPTEYRRKYKA